MVYKVLSAAIVAAAFCFNAAQSQTVSDVGGPSEVPPASFNQQTYTDSRGCVFLRAGFGGTITWVPRVDRNRKVMCGYPPSLGAKARVAVAAPPRNVGKPMDTVASTTTPPKIRAAVSVQTIAPETYVPAPVRSMVQTPQRPVMPVPVVPVVVAAAPQIAPQPARVTGDRIGCYADAPVAQRLRLTNGKTVLVCTRGDGTLDGLRAPVFPAGSGVGAAFADANAPLGQPAAGSGQAVRVAETRTKLPAGYKAAFRDDRLNPLRGVGTAQGDADQDRVWTRKVPAQEVRRVAVEQPTVVMSTKGAPTPQGAGRSYVQIGSFGVTANADGAAARLSALGLPVARQNISRKGKALQVVLAGPFGSATEAQAALSAVRHAGFGDAFVR